MSVLQQVGQKRSNLRILISPRRQGGDVGGVPLKAARQGAKLHCRSRCFDGKKVTLEFPIQLLRQSQFPRLYVLTPRAEFYVQRPRGGKCFLNNCAHVGNRRPVVRQLGCWLVKKLGLNLIGPQVSKWRDCRGWSQRTCARLLQLQGWSISRHSLAKLELGLRRVSDREFFPRQSFTRGSSRFCSHARCRLRRSGQHFKGEAEPHCFQRAGTNNLLN